MYPREQLRSTLSRIDGRPYPAYRDLAGSYAFELFRMDIAHVQADPFASPSRIVVRLPLAASGLRPADVSGEVRRVATEDWLLRRFAAAVVRAAGGPTQDPLPGACLRVAQPGQQVLARSAVMVERGEVVVRLGCALPADRRDVQAQRAAAALDVALPAAVAAMLPQGPADLASLAAHGDLCEDQQYLRSELEKRDWIAFVADGAILARESGTSDAPLPRPAAQPLVAPESLAATVRLPHRGEVRGLAIPCGVVLIVGGGYHGKSTLLRALERGVYDHVAGDGRELCITRAGAVGVASEDGRAVTGVDISAFVRPLPGGVDTRRFTTLAASGSTSQAAALCEAVELGADCLLLDEDRCAANFMARDARMRALVPDDEEPVVPFVQRVRWLHRARGISTVLVVGGAGSFLDEADCVLRLRDFQPEDRTVEARSVAASLAEPPRPAGPTPELPAPRVLAADALGGPADAGDRLRVRVRGEDILSVGDADVDLGAIGQLVEPGQRRALADLVPLAARYADGQRTLAEVVREAEADLDRLGLAACSPWQGQCPGDYARPRSFELGAVLNRIPGLGVSGQERSARPVRPVRVRRAEPLQLAHAGRSDEADPSAAPVGARRFEDGQRGGFVAREGSGGAGRAAAGPREGARRFEGERRGGFVAREGSGGAGRAAAGPREGARRFEGGQRGGFVAREGSGGAGRPAVGRGGAARPGMRPTFGTLAGFGGRLTRPAGRFDTRPGPARERK